MRPLRLKMGMLRQLLPKSVMLRPVRLKMGMLRFCATEEFLCDFGRRRPKEDMLQFCVTQFMYVATLRGPD